MTYSVKGKQYVAIASQSVLLCSVFPRSHLNLVARLRDQKLCRRKTSSYRTDSPARTGLREVTSATEVWDERKRVAT